MVLSNYSNSCCFFSLLEAVAKRFLLLFAITFAILKDRNSWKIDNYRKSNTEKKNWKNYHNKTLFRILGAPIIFSSTVLFARIIRYFLLLCCKNALSKDWKKEQGVVYNNINNYVIIVYIFHFIFPLYV